MLVNLQKHRKISVQFRHAPFAQVGWIQGRAIVCAEAEQISVWRRENHIARCNAENVLEKCIGIRHMLNHIAGNNQIRMGRRRGRKV